MFVHRIKKVTKKQKKCDVLPSGGLFAFWDRTPSLSLPLSRSVKTGGGGGNVDVAPGNWLLVTNHGLTGFPDIKVDPGLEKFVSFVYEFF